MYADVRYSRDITKPLRYNEEKLQQKKAESLLAENFLKDVEKLSHKDKLNHFRHLTSLNTKTEANAIHITVNFSPSDKLSNERMKDLAKEYMGKIGLGQQPFLVYRHHDSAHPHMHIVSTNIKTDGKRIDMLDIILHKSQQVAKEMAREHSLRMIGQKEAHELNPSERIYASKMVPGESLIQPGISAVLDKVIDHYRYTSLAELNAVLGLYNVRAERATVGSTMYQYGGLYYAVIDEEGKKKGKGIKASAFDLKPTLKNLEAKFAANESLPKNDQRIKTAIDWTFAGDSLDLKGFQQEIEKERISIVPENDKKGMLQNIYYVDHLTQTVFDGNKLGGSYGVKGILERCLEYKPPEQNLSQEIDQRLRLGL